MRESRTLFGFCHNATRHVPHHLDRRYPGIRFRIVTEQGTIRQHIRIFVNGEQIPHLGVPVRPDDQIHIVCALSGG
ncbi:MAG: MoaD/ThiS family protein [Nitrospira defluvii]|nr:MoaD/ThiS family protein [Nitrospira defluvii]